MHNYNLRLKLLIALFSLLIIEFFLHLTYNPPIFDKKYKYDTISWLQKYVHLNSYGYRDEEYLTRKKPEGYRIFTIGDSFTFGWFIDNPSDTFPEIIEEGLKAKSKKNIEVINASQFGFNFNEIADRFVTDGRKFQPDLVLLGFHSYKIDVGNSKYIARRDNRFPKFILNSRLYHLLIGQHFVKQSEIANEKLFLAMYKNKNSPELKELVTKLDFLNNEVKKSGAKLAIILFPYINASEPDKEYSFYAYNNALAEYGRENDVLIIDPLEGFRKYNKKSELVLTPFDSHPTVPLHKIAAQSFLNSFDLEKYSAPPLLVDQTFVATEENKNLENYQEIVSVHSSINSYPWIAFEKKYGASISLPIENKSKAQTFIQADRLILSENTYPGIEMSYHLYPKEDGLLVIPDKVRGYEVSGFVKFFGLNGQGSSAFNPTQIYKQGDNYYVHFSKGLNFEIVEAHLTVASNILTIDSDSQISKVEIVKKMNVTLNQDSNSLQLPFKEKVTGYPQLDSSQKLKSIANAFPIIKSLLKKVGILNKDTKLNPSVKKLFVPNTGKLYAFMNGKYLPFATFTQSDNKLSLQFENTLKKGTRIEFYVKAETNLKEVKDLQINLTKREE